MVLVTTRQCIRSGEPVALSKSLGTGQHDSVRSFLIPCVLVLIIFSIVRVFDFEGDSENTFSRRIPKKLQKKETYIGLAR